MTGCVRCQQLEKQLREAHMVVEELWRQDRHRRALAEGHYVDYNSGEVPSMKSLLAGRVIEEKAA